MLRRVLALAAGVVLASAGTLAVASSAQAVTAPAQPTTARATVDITFGPISIGDYCYAKVSTLAFIGFYEPGGLKCYSRTSTGLGFVGYGDPYLACKYLTTDVVMSAFRGAGDALVCRVIR